MKVIKLNRSNVYDWIEELKNKVDTVATIKASIDEMFIESIILGRIVVYLAIEDDSILGWALVMNLFLETELLIIENFDSVKGVGRLLLNAIKNDYNIITAEALKTAVGFYSKNGFTIEKEYNTSLNPLKSGLGFNL